MVTLERKYVQWLSKKYFREQHTSILETNFHNYNLLKHCSVNYFPELIYVMESNFQNYVLTNKMVGLKIKIINRREQLYLANTGHVNRKCLSLIPHVNWAPPSSLFFSLIQYLFLCFAFLFWLHLAYIYQQDVSIR